MSIDEAIEFCNEKSKNIKLRTEPKTFEQITEWLEELKANRIALEKANGYLEANYRLGYSNAIDDLLEDANEMAIEVDAGTYTMKAIGIGLLEQIAEQLKAGGVNDNRY